MKIFFLLKIDFFLFFIILFSNCGMNEDMCNSYSKDVVWNGVNIVKVEPNSEVIFDVTSYDYDSIYYSVILSKSDIIKDIYSYPGERVGLIKDDVFKFISGSDTLELEILPIEFNNQSIRELLIPAFTTHTSNVNQIVKYDSLILSGYLLSKCERNIGNRKVSKGSTFYVSRLKVSGKDIDTWWE